MIDVFDEQLFILEVHLVAGVILKGIGKVYPGGVRAVTDFNLKIKNKEFIVFVGPSGCGKSTTLRMIAGLEEISEGELYIDDRLVNDIPPKDRDIAMVFQNYALYPHMTVFENMAFGLKLRKVPKDEIARKVEEAAREELTRRREFLTSRICLKDARRLFPEVRDSVSHSDVRSSANRRSSFSTSLFPTLMRNCVPR